MSKLKKFLHLGVAMTVGLSSTVSRAANGPSSSSQTLNEATAALFKDQRPDGFWNYTSALGPHYAALYLMAQNWLGNGKKFMREREELRDLLLERRFPNGAWQAVNDPNLSQDQRTDLNASIINYWYLKSMGVSINTPAMRQARAVILKRGGLEASSLFTKILLATFNNASWSFVPKVPFGLFKENGLMGVSDQDLAQWVGPHLLAIAYLKEFELSRDLGPRFRVDELSTQPQEWSSFRRGSRLQLISREASKFDAKFSKFAGRYLHWFEVVRERQRAHGSWGAYTLATFLSMMALDDFRLRLKANPQLATRHRNVPSDLEIRKMIARGADYCSKMTFQEGTEGHLNGITQDARNWDTALVGIGIIDANPNLSAKERAALIKAADQLVADQHVNGGFGFGWDFELDPDTDDTAEIMLFLGALDGQRYRHAILKAARFLRDFQNDDGGWGAFAKNNNGNPMVRLAAHKFEDSADLFDESSPDVTGHVLEAFGVLGLARANDPFIRKAVRYLERTRSKELPVWVARWGINTIYGTSAVTVGLLSLGIPANDPLIAPSLDWLESLQNRDGGFGETTLSYADLRLAGKGVSTPSQTAWAMLPLLKANRRGPVLDRAADYLNRTFRSDGRWVDPAAVGTGHPLLIYMDYYSYPRSWPLMALGRYHHAR